jgi:hypothetical protein
MGKNKGSFSCFLSSRQGGVQQYGLCTICTYLFIIILSAKVTRLMWQLCERLEPEEI